MSTVTLLVERRLNIIGANVRQLRSKADLTQDQLAARCQVAGFQVSRVAIAQIESARRAVTDFEAYCLAKALRVEIGVLFPKRARPIERKPQNPTGRERKRSGEG